jgi:hypothetical protein
MELHYAKHVKYEGEENEYLTWVWNDNKMSSDYGWSKRPVPNFSCGEVAGGGKPTCPIDTAKNAEAWFKSSNREDMIFIEKELMECQYWRDAINNEIAVAQNVLS